MTDGLAALFERADCRDDPSFNRADLDHWQLKTSLLPFVKPATTPENITCPGCHESCLKPVRKQNGQISIWCDEVPALGHIALEPEDLKVWQVDMPTLANTLSGLLGMDKAQEIVPHRAYDLGMLENNTLFLLRGAEWENGKDVCYDTRIRNASPLLIPLSPLPEAISLPALWIGQLLDLKAGKLAVNKERLAAATCRDTTPEGNIFRKEGDFWRVRFEGKEAMIKHSNGMVYIDHLLHHPNQDIPALTLQALTSKAPPSGVIPHDSAFEDTAMLGSDPVMDAKAQQNIQRRIEILQETQPDSAEILELESHLRGSTFRGKRKAFTDSNERARVAVTKAINSAVKKLESSIPAFGKQLKSHLQTGHLCKYDV